MQADANGQPGQVLEDIPLQGLQAVPTIIAATSSLQSSLRVGTRYWLTVVAGAAGTIGEWNLSSIGDVANGNMAVTGTGSPLGPWGPVFGLPTTAFAINATPPTAQDVLQFAMDAVSRLVADGTVVRGRW